MNKINCLVTAVSGGSVGEQIRDALELAKTPYRIITTNTDPNKAGLYFSDAGYLIPLASDANFIASLLKICRKEKIQVIIPGSTPELIALSNMRNLFEKERILVLINSKDVIDLCEDKLATMQFLKNNGLFFPKFAVLEGEYLPKGLKFPVVVKPYKGGGGSRNVFIAQDKEDLAFYHSYYKKQDLSAIVQEYIGSAEEEYTVGTLTDFEGQLIGSMVMKREVKSDLSTRLILKDIRRDKKEPLVLSSGFSQGFVNNYPDVQKYAEKITLILGSKGPLNIQCRKTSRRIFTMEINPRFSGTSAIRALLGFNEPDILIRKYLLGKKITKISYKKGLVLRDLKMRYIAFGQINRVKKNKFIENKK